MRHDDRHVGEIHCDVIDRQRISVLEPHSTTSGQASADAAVPGVKKDREFRFREEFVKRIGNAIVRKELLNWRMEFQSANRAGGEKPSGIGHTLGSAMRVNADEWNGDIGIVGSKAQHSIV